MLKVKDLDESKLPKEFLDVLPKTCDVCGADTEITESLSMLCCPNPWCMAKARERLLAMLKDLGVKNLGESKCEKFLANFKTTNPYAIWMYEPDKDGPLYRGCSMEFSQSIYEQLNGMRDMLLWEFVRMGNLPGIRDSARHLFMQYSDLQEFYDDLESGGIGFIQELLGIKGKPVDASSLNTDVLVTGDDDDDSSAPASVKAMTIYESLVTFKDDLFEALPFVRISTVDKVLNICISSAVGAPYKSKQDFVTQMNNRYGSKVHLNFLGSVTKDCQYLIWSKEGLPTNKVSKAEKLKVPIMTGEEFRRMLESM